MRKQEDTGGKTHWVEETASIQHCHTAPSGGEKQVCSVHQYVKPPTMQSKCTHFNQSAAIIEASATWRLIPDLDPTSASYSNIWLPFMWWHLSMRTGPLRRETSRQRSSVLISLSAVYENTWKTADEIKRDCDDFSSSHSWNGNHGSLNNLSPGFHPCRDSWKSQLSHSPSSPCCPHTGWSPHFWSGGGLATFQTTAKMDPPNLWYEPEERPLYCPRSHKALSDYENGKWNIIRLLISSLFPWYESKWTIWGIFKMLFCWQQPASRIKQMINKWPHIKYTLDLKSWDKW